MQEEPLHNLKSTPVKQSKHNQELANKIREKSNVKVLSNEQAKDTSKANRVEHLHKVTQNRYDSSIKTNKQTKQ